MSCGAVCEQPGEHGQFPEDFSAKKGLEKENPKPELGGAVRRTGLALIFSK
jgi:hypothetical protein